MATRRVRAFKRWMKSQGIECSDALDLIEGDDSLSVRTLCNLHEGDLVATIPKQTCLTMKTSGARPLIEAAGLSGYLGLSIALMYERSLGPLSPWFDYLQLLPQSEAIPLLWSFREVDSLLSGTELHEIVKEDRSLIYEDWKECIFPLFDFALIKLNPDFFSLEQYLSAKSLIASRSFEIDEHHGFGMVPLADLFNHKTGAEDVHFTSVSSHLEFDNDSDDSNRYGENGNGNDDEPFFQCNQSIKHSYGDSILKGPDVEDSPSVLQMIIVKDVKAGAEVFNTYGSLGNAALLHRYGFTEPDNPYDIVNVDLKLVLQWSSSLFSARHCRTRLSLWRKLDYSEFLGQNFEYFEISADGEPEIELLILLYIMLLPEEAYLDLDLRVSTAGTLKKPRDVVLSRKGHITLEKGKKIGKNLLLTSSVQSALLSLANLRESLYGSRPLEDEIQELKRCCPTKERKFYHSLMLRVSERRILEKLKSYASAADGFINAVRSSKRKSKAT